MIDGFLACPVLLSLGLHAAAGSNARGLRSSASTPSRRSDLASTVSMVPCDSSAATAKTSLLSSRNSAELLLTFRSTGR